MGREAGHFPIRVGLCLFPLPVYDGVIVGMGVCYIPPPDAVMAMPWG